MKRRILPRRRKLLRRHSDPDSGFDLDVSSFGDVFAGGSVLLSLVLAIVVPVALVLAILFSELLLMLLLLPVALMFRVLFKRPWVVEVRRNGKLDHVELVQRWSAAGDRVTVIADRIRAVGGRGSISKSRYDAT